MIQPCNPRARDSVGASPTGTRLHCSLLLPRRIASLKGLSHWDSAAGSLLLLRSTASLKGLSHWDSATTQLAPPTEHSLPQGSLPLRLGHIAACSSHGAQPRSRASPTRTRPHCSLLLPRRTASLKGLP
ncbi:hypothetical protein Adt_14205 [Abeliophyllum distichum]|uniref:Uncharacterized protein n=1 Tax=Abeliophyllum distichum TaxID=126358 RepID=A0ABD1TZG2_9LAMI